MSNIVIIMEIVFVFSIAALATLLWRHRGHWFIPFEQLDRHEQEYHRKKELVVRRAERQMEEWWSTIKTYARPIISSAVSITKRWYQALIELEQRYRKNVEALKLTGPQKVERITTMLDAADAEMAKEDWGQAEAKFIEVLTMQNTHLRAYEGLAEVYWNMGKWKEAMETYKFVARLLQEKTPIGYYHRWAEAAKECERYSQAIKALQKAIEIEPNNPRTLDLLTENAILDGNLDLARDALEKLKIANPENQKIADFQKRIDETGALASTL
ncbi:tetratricopeptide repeat protein [Candidatus Uhrbacteria bacterium]|nr:tetratricopeptide repeat protein [Candidatus Uhrbacteria bacterium]